MNYFYWIAIGVLLSFLEILIPGGIIIFLGMSAVTVGVAIYFGFIHTLTNALLTWFIVSLFQVIVLRSFFMKYFEGDTSVKNVDETVDIIGSVVEVCEEIFPHKEGRVRFRATTWKARSDENLEFGKKVRVINQDGGTLIVKSI